MWKVRDCLAQKYSREELMPWGRATYHEADSDLKIPDKLTEQMISPLNSLYPDSQAMVDYLDFMGIPPKEALRGAGFRVL